MSGKLQREIRQSRPFSSLEEEAVLNILFTADLVQQDIADVLRPHDLSAVQYNALRILRGSGREGAHCKDVGERMVTRDPDITRLVDRLQKRGLVERTRGARDRRFVTVSITAEGLSLLASLDGPVQDAAVRRLGHLGQERLSELIELLESVRT
ncbi:MAG: MarR family transcriptional regulator [Bryobacteraceae bacterium]|nr:MarR family transcriptional regulator [Bryobacteraceae bacterium]